MHRMDCRAVNTVNNLCRLHSEFWWLCSRFWWSYPRFHHKSSMARAFQHLGFDPREFWREPTCKPTGDRCWTTCGQRMTWICLPQPPEGKLKVSGNSAMKASIKKVPGDWRFVFCLYPSLVRKPVLKSKQACEKQSESKSTSSVSSRFLTSWNHTYLAFFPARSLKSTSHSGTFIKLAHLLMVTAPLRRPHCCKFYHVILSWS